MDEQFGIRANMDSLGRVTIPKQIRDIYNFDTMSYVEAVITKEGVLIRPMSYEVIFKKKGEK